MNRRQILHALGGSLALLRCGGSSTPESESTAAGSAASGPRLTRTNVCFITDEVNSDLDAAIAFAKEFSIPQVEIRSLDNKYGFLHETPKLKEYHKKIDDAGLNVAALSTPLMKCLAPGVEVAPWVHREIKLSEPGFPIPHEEQFGRTGEFLEKSIEAAGILGTDKIRVFSFWRGVDPVSVHPAIIEKLEELAPIAANAGMKLCMENEAACNVADCKELMAVIPKSPENIGILWDPMNATSTGEVPYPDGYNLLDKSRIWHVQLKDAQIDAQTGERKTVAVGTGIIPYAKIFKALAADGYTGAISMETHFRIDGSRDQASRLSIEGVFRALDAQA